MATKTVQEIDLGELLHGASLESDGHPDFVTASRIIDCRNGLGECIIFDDRQQVVLWTDIYGKKLHHLQLNYDKRAKICHTAYDLPKQLCSFGLLETVKEGTELPLLCAWEDSFQLYDVAAGKPLGEVSIGEPVNPNQQPSRLNDGRVDPAGRYYICGAYFGNIPVFYEKVFRVEQHADGKVYHEPIVDKIQVTNSIAWTPDGARMYLADSPTKQIHSYAYDVERGTLSDKKLVHEKDASIHSVPDGSCVDTEGYLWNAVWCLRDTSSVVQRIDPSTGHVVFTVHLPDVVSQVSCCCFGGENMDILFITTAAVEREVQPHAGALYAAKVPFQGRKESRLRFRY